MATQHTTPTMNSMGKDLSNKAETAYKDAKDSATKAVSKIEDEAHDFIGSDVVGTLKGVASDLKSSLSDIRAQGAKYVGQSEDMIKKYPFVAIAGAVAVGAIVGGYFLRRSTKSSV